MNNELKPCPFCGWRAFIGKTKSEHPYYWVYCGLENCSVNPKTKAFNRKEYAIEVWNRRVTRND